MNPSDYGPAPAELRDRIKNDPWARELGIRYLDLRRGYCRVSLEVAPHVVNFQGRRVVPIRDRRWVIEHVGVLTADEVSRIRDLGVVVTTHTNRYLFKEGAFFRSQVGPGAEDTIVPLCRLKEAGVHVALATDNVPPSLFLPVWQAIARADRAGEVTAPSQRLSREDALRAVTIEGAYLTFEEDQKGSIESGKLADLVVLSDDLLTCDEARIRDITADMTIVGGRIVHEVQ